jgi:hypothetical protein
MALHIAGMIYLRWLYTCHARCTWGYPHSTPAHPNPVLFALFKIRTSTPWVQEDDPCTTAEGKYDPVLYKCVDGTACEVGWAGNGWQASEVIGWQLGRENFGWARRGLARRLRHEASISPKHANLAKGLALFITCCRNAAIAQELRTVLALSAACPPAGPAMAKQPGGCPDCSNLMSP